MNLDEVKKLEQLLKDKGYKTKSDDGWSKEVKFAKKIKTDDKDITLVISGSFNWRIEAE